MSEGSPPQRASVDEIQKSIEEFLKAEHRAPGHDESLIVKGKPSFSASTTKYARGKNSTVNAYLRECILPVYFSPNNLIADDPVLISTVNEQVRGADKESTFKARMDACKGLVLKKIGNPLFLAQTFFSEADLAIMKVNVEIAAQRGFPECFKSFQQMARNMARAKLQAQVNDGLRESFNDWLDTDTERPNGDIPACSDSFFRRSFINIIPFVTNVTTIFVPFSFLDHYKDIKFYKSCPIDPVRAAQANRDVAIAMEGLLQRVLDDLRKQGVIAADQWRTWADVPEHLKYNMDEVGFNGVFRSGKKLASAATSQVPVFVIFSGR